MTKKPPECYHCGEELRAIYVDESFRYKFDEKSGRYHEGTWGGSYTAICPICDNDVSHMFEDGVCNYRVKDDG